MKLEKYVATIRVPLLGNEEVCSWLSHNSAVYKHPTWDSGVNGIANHVLLAHINKLKSGIETFSPACLHIFPPIKALQRRTLPRPMPKVPHELMYNTRKPLDTTFLATTTDTYYMHSMSESPHSHGPYSPVLVHLGSLDARPITPSRLQRGRNFPWPVCITLYALHSASWNRHVVRSTRPPSGESRSLAFQGHSSRPRWCCSVQLLSRSGSRIVDDTYLEGEIGPRPCSERWVFGVRAIGGDYAGSL